MAVYDTLNEKQQEAVLHTEGPLLILAGAGSGKTRVLTHRIAYLIEEKGVNPWNILAITFTNKAAGEMRNRVDYLVESGGGSVWVSTFHSLCVRILRRFIEYLGYENNFTIYDSDDQKTLMKQVIKRLDLDPKQYRERAMMTVISNAKNELIGVEEFRKNAQGDWHLRKYADIYEAYQTELKKNNALDFDDLIFKTVDLFRVNQEVLDYYRERFLYILVDEYQDTNTAQFELISLLAGKYGNLCVVGDDDQSIYKFRGADIGNILNFEETFPGTKVIKLEQNYRSTGHILDAANAVIRNNRGRKEKTLWTANEEGEPVTFQQYDQAYEEAEGIARQILFQRRSYKDFAVLYRTNAQSRLLEEKCLAYNIPYRLVGGVNFYQRKEIKDILCYMKTIANGRDDLAVQRIINVPKRGIGAASIGKIVGWAGEQGLSFYEGCVQAASVPGMGKAAGKIQGFVSQIEAFRRRIQGWEIAYVTGGGSEGEAGDLGGSKGSPTEDSYVQQREKWPDIDYGIPELIKDILETTGYRQELEAEGEEDANARLENIDELISKAVSYCEENESPSLDGFLEEVALVADVDRMDDSEDRVTLMTLHSAKGLEFPVVFLSGMEDGLFPSSMTIMSDDPTDLEEERRLCYVGITRARQRLVMTGARVRMTKGEARYSRVSRFVEEIPEQLLCTAKPEGWTDRKTDKDFARNEDLPWNQNQKKLGVSMFGMKSNSYASPSTGYREKGFDGKTALGGDTRPSKSPGFGKTFTVEKPSSLDYEAGSRVRHKKFGDGTVRSVVDRVKDFEVTVDFDQCGIKKMFASFAQLQRL
jgi:DNA helicase-2/ATP-dependent DNA helicase PcrA